MDNALRITIESRGTFTTVEGVYPRVFIGRRVPDQPLVVSRRPIPDTIMELDSSTGEISVRADSPTIQLNGKPLPVPPPRLRQGDRLSIGKDTVLTFSDSASGDIALPGGRLHDPEGATQGGGNPVEAEWLRSCESHADVILRRSSLAEEIQTAREAPHRRFGRYLERPGAPYLHPNATPEGREFL